MKLFWIKVTHLDPPVTLYDYYFRAQTFADVLHIIAGWEPHPVTDHFKDILQTASGDYTMTITVLDEKPIR